MKRTMGIRLPALAAVVLLAGVGAAAGAPDRPDAKIRWKTDYNAAVKEARRRRKPLLVEFYATWCGPCKRMEEETFRDPGVVRQSERFVPVRVDIDRQPQLARKYGAFSIPFAVVLSPKEKVQASALGYHAPGPFLRFLRRGLEE